jgi:hypothetical protein
MDIEAVAGIRARLEVLADELADLGRASLREAIDTDSRAAVADERALGRARRAVLKAVAVLGGEQAEEP